MARRKKSGGIDGLIELVSLMPWWAGVALALIAYAVLHRVAAQQVVAATTAGQIGEMMTQTIWKSAAAVGQYVVPLICLTGASLSAWKRHERKALVANVVESKAADSLDRMSWQQFEKLVGEAFRLQGYAVIETGGGGADGGVDLILNRGGEKFLVQCKQWRAFKVGVDVVRELYGVMAATGAAGGFVVTSGRYTDEASAFASGRNVRLVDGPKLHALIRQAVAWDTLHAGAPVRCVDRAPPPSRVTRIQQSHAHCQSHRPRQSFHRTAERRRRQQVHRHPRQGDVSGRAL